MNKLVSYVNIIGEASKEKFDKWFHFAKQYVLCNTTIKGDSLIISFNSLDEYIIHVYNYAGKGSCVSILIEKLRISRKDVDFILILDKFIEMLALDAEKFYSKNDHIYRVKILSGHIMDDNIYKEVVVPPEFDYALRREIIRAKINECLDTLNTSTEINHIEECRAKLSILADELKVLNKAINSIEKFRI